MRSGILFAGTKVVHRLRVDSPLHFDIGDLKVARIDIVLDLSKSKK
jgi:hypothetical protein